MNFESRMKGWLRYGLLDFLLICSLVLVILFAATPGYAQPSGGPYGPIDQRYEIPKAAHVYYVAPDGKADSSGTSQEQPTTLEVAIERVVTGDAIVMLRGLPCGVKVV